MHPSRNSTSARKNATGESPSAAATSVVSTDIDWVETAATSQAPLMPVCSDGLSRRTITAVKNAYITTNHSTRPSTHSSRAGRNASATNSSCVPSTPVAATMVKKPGPTEWFIRSASRRRGKRASRSSVSPHSAR
jgi:hypothetical protein